MGYRDEFEEAIDRADRFGLDIISYEFVENEILTENVVTVFVREFRAFSKDMPLERIVAQCFYVCLISKEMIERIICSEVYFTLGYVETSQRNMFYQNEDSLKDLLRNGLHGESLSLHAWLTLPSMEIIDLTLPISFAIANKQNIEGDIIANHPDKLQKGLKFHPMLVGDRFLYESGAIRMEMCY